MLLSIMAFAPWKVGDVCKGSAATVGLGAREHPQLPPGDHSTTGLGVSLRQGMRSLSMLMFTRQKASNPFFPQSPKEQKERTKPCHSPHQPLRASFVEGSLKAQQAAAG